MKKFKIIIALVLTFLMVFSTVACSGDTGNDGGGGKPSTGGSPQTPGQQTPGQQTPGQQTPGQQTKTDMQKFLDAKATTYASDSFKYNYTTNANLRFKGAPLPSAATTEGEVCYNKNAGDTVYVHKKENSGALIFDSTTYIYNKGLDLFEINADESKDFSVIDNSQITSNYDFETNSLGKLLKGLTADNISAVSKINDEYSITLKTNFSGTFLSILNFIDSQKIVDTISKYTNDLANVTPSFVCKAELSADESTIKSYTLNVTINIQNVADIDFSYTQSFASIGQNTAINIPVFQNTITDESAITSNLSNVVSALNETLSAPSSYYTYTLKTEVDHGISKNNPLGLAVNSTSAGFAQRQIIGNDIFFHNRLELDSDYKNDDQYPDIVVDYERYRARVNNAGKDVYDVTDGLIKNTYDLIENYNNSDIDEYYMMINAGWLSSDYIKIMRVTENQDGTSKYELGLSNNAVKSILLYYNDHIRLDADLVTDIDVYKIASDFSAKKATFEILLDANGDIKSIVINTNGFYTLSDGEQVKFELELDIEFDNTKTYTAPTDYKDIELPNS